MVILIPARANSKRVPGKALKELGGKPLIAWSIRAAKQIMLSRAVVCSEDNAILRVAESYGAEVWRRPLYTATDDAPDLTWLSLALSEYPDADMFMVHRPTSPFLTPDTMERAIFDLVAVPDATAMRAMRLITEHPMKMWTRDGLWMHRACGGATDWKVGVEHHSCPTQMLPRVYVQTAGLEIIRRSTLESGSLTGDRLLPLFLEGPEALDINTPEDWARAEEIAKTWTP